MTARAKPLEITEAAAGTGRNEKVPSANDRHSSNHQLIVVSGQTGKFAPLYRAAHGKALLADCGERDSGRWLDDTSHSVGDIASQPTAYLPVSVDLLGLN